MTHLVRAGGLLALLIMGLLIARAQFVPASFGEFGFYRAANVSEWEAQPIQYVSEDTCQECHPENYRMWSESKHASVHCENCHGPAREHIENGSSLSVNPSRELCGMCHGRLLSRPEDFPQIDLDSHGGKFPCISCHTPYAPEGAKVPDIPHSTRGLPDCLVCHGPQGTRPFPENHAGRTSDVCASCHVID